MKKDKDIQKVLLTPAQIRRGVKKLAAQISKDYAGRPLVLICVLKGSVVFLADLIRQLTIPCAVDFISVSSYGTEAESSGVVRLTMDLRESPEGKDLLVIEDMLDTGLTIQYLLDNLRTRKPRTIKVCALMDKPANRKVPIRADYAAFRIPSKFVVGYGLDYAERYRNLPYVGVLKENVLKGNSH